MMRRRQAPTTPSVSVFRLLARRAVWLKANPLRLSLGVHHFMANVKLIPVSGACACACVRVVFVVQTMRRCSWWTHASRN